MILTRLITHLLPDMFLKRPSGTIPSLLFFKALTGSQAYWWHLCSVPDSITCPTHNVYRANESNKSSKARHDHYITFRNSCADTLQ